MARLLFYSSISFCFAGNWDMCICICVSFTSTTDDVILWFCETKARRRMKKAEIMGGRSGARTYVVQTNIQNQTWLTRDLPSSTRGRRQDRSSWLASRLSKLDATVFDQHWPCRIGPSQPSWEANGNWSHLSKTTNHKRRTQDPSLTIGLFESPQPNIDYCDKFLDALLHFIEVWSCLAVWHSIVMRD